MAPTTTTLLALAYLAASVLAQKANTFEIVGLTGASGESPLRFCLPALGSNLLGEDSVEDGGAEADSDLGDCFVCLDVQPSSFSWTLCVELRGHARVVL